MSAPAYYNEWDQYAAQWLRNLIAAGHLPAGEVDTRSVADVRPDDLAGFRQCHFFAGIGGWALAARLAGWPDDRELWTGSCPCQPFSVAGKGAGTDDERHLWPHQFRLLRARRPAVWMGEQVAAAVGKDWLDGVLSDLEGIGYACRAVVVPACAVDGPHRRDRLWIVADADGRGREAGPGPDAMAAAARGEGSAGDQPAHAPDGNGGPGRVADPSRGRRSEPGARQIQQPGRAEAVGGSEAGDVADACGDGLNRGAQFDQHAQQPGQQAPRRDDVDGCSLDRRGNCSAWTGASWIIGHDGKARRVEPSIRLLAHGVPARVGRLRAYGNAIVPQVAAEVICAFMECRP